jgi:NADPH:quinone reductase-like Zn-dependent oxidoreductase
MKRWAYDHYGTPDVLRYEDSAAPAAPANGVVVRVEAASINSKDWRLLVADPWMIRVMFGSLRGPKGGRVPGDDFAGVVTDVGGGVGDVAVGDEVYGHSPQGGALAEYIAVPADAVVPKPARLGFVEAATLPIAAATALVALRDVARVSPGDRVLVNGAAGGVGTFAVQIAKALGAGRIVAVCSARNLAQARALGADLAVDYEREDVTRLDETFDAVVDSAGGHSLRRMLSIVAPRGRIALVGGGSGGRLLGPFGQILRWEAAARFVGREIHRVTTVITRDVLRDLSALVDAGDVTPVVDEVYPLSAVPDALRYLGTGHARAKIAVTV